MESSRLSLYQGVEKRLKDVVYKEAEKENQVDTERRVSFSTYRTLQSIKKR